MTLGRAGSGSAAKTTASGRTRPHVDVITRRNLSTRERPGHVGDEGRRRRPELAHEDEVGRVSLRDGERGRVGDGEHAKEERRKWRLVLAREYEQERHGRKKDA